MDSILAGGKSTVPRHDLLETVVVLGRKFSELAWVGLLLHVQAFAGNTPGASVQAQAKDLIYIDKCPMMVSVCKTAPAFEDTWIKCRGDVSRTRMTN